MSKSINTILILGATSGIGEAFAHRFHQQGKKVILAGRRENRLKSLQQTLPGSEYIVFDIADLANLPAKTAETLKRFPQLDTVWINAGIQRDWSITNPETSNAQVIQEEITTNITAPMTLARLFVPHLLSLGSEANLLFTSSGLGFGPSRFPVYCASKAAIHSFAVVLRQQLKGTNVNILEIVPPFIHTELGASLKMDKSKLPPAMDLGDFTREIFDQLDNNDAANLKELAAGTAARRVELWRESIGGWLEQTGIGG